MKIEILGMGCPKCEKTADATKKAVEMLGKDIEIVKITDIKEIMNYNVMVTPALVIDGKVKVSGRVPTVEEVKKWIEQA